jgi:hypothetical protein
MAKTVNPFSMLIVLCLLGMGWVIVDERVNSARRRHDETASQELLLAFGFSLENYDKNPKVYCAAARSQLEDLQRQIRAISTGEAFSIRDLTLIKRFDKMSEVQLKYTSCGP